MLVRTEYVWYLASAHVRAVGFRVTLCIVSDTHHMAWVRTVIRNTTVENTQIAKDNPAFWNLHLLWAVALRSAQGSHLRSFELECGPM